jgi:site-specific recombinase XerD
MGDPAEASNALLLIDAPISIDATLIDAARRAMSPNSWRALRADVRVFAGWCKTEGRTVTPALSETVAEFLRHQAALGKKAATLSRYASSIARLHSLTDLPDPTTTELVRLELKAQRRALGVRQRQAPGLRFRGEVPDPLAAAGPVGVCVEAMLASAPKDPQGIRDRALLSLAFDTGLRRSEIVAVQWGHVERSATGGRLFVPRSKGDQEAAGAYAYLSARTMNALEEWRRDTGKAEGPVFRRLHRSITKEEKSVWTTGAPLSAQSVTLIYRTMLSRARDDGYLGMISDADFEHWRSSLTAHSTRIGLTQDLFASGQDLAGIMQALRWKSPAQPARYAQALSVEANAAAKVVGRL